MAWLKWIGVGVILLGAGGCGRAARQRAEMVRAIDGFYGTEPACLWFEPVEFPVEVDAADVQGRDGLEALVGQGLLVRTKIDAVGVDPAGVRYELTVTGKKAWRPDVGHAGFGNICYGDTKVLEVGSAVARRDEVFGDVTDVAYLTELKHPPPWTMSPEVKTAFPRVKLELTGPMPGSATLKQTGDGWRVAAAGPVHPVRAVVDGAGEPIRH